MAFVLDIWSVLKDPAWLFFGLTVFIGAAGLALLALYPLGRD
jgi:hypothetical protein